MRINLPTISPINGVILYDGLSLLNKKPIIAIAVNLNEKSSNRKTGDFIQTYIIPKNLKPTDAINNGEDEAVCGNCPHRKINWGSCYVNAGMSVNGVWGAFQRNKYPLFDKEKHIDLFKNRLIRLGSFGNPSAIPFDIWTPILEVSSGNTSYVHNWKTCDQRWKTVSMASVDNPKELKQAKQMGWKTFRVRRSDEPILRGEFSCPASIEQNKRLKCEDCLACCGTKGYNNGKTVTPTIVSHGLDWKSKRFNLGSKLREQKKKFKNISNSK